MSQWKSQRRSAAPLGSMHSALVAFARRLVDADTAEDLVQEAYVRVMEGGRPDAVTLPLSYFKVVVRNLAIDNYSRRTRDSAAAQKAKGRLERDPSTLVESAQFQDDLRDRMAELSKRQWESLVMTVVLGMTEHEAASAADVSRSAVTGSRERAIQWLRETVNERKKTNPSRIAG
ncbi:MAG: sigma-70 family RNA polymerase sigma factor [Phycisphaerae bacterium]|nr:sigma-70 family RNA polymerase sigma factor [Phycisphaerae bacterium]